MKKLGMLILMAAIAVTTVQAETLALWENNDVVTATNSTPADSSALGVSAGNLELGPGLFAPSTTWPNALDAGINANATNLAAAIANNHYFNFTVTPDTGKQMACSNVFARVSLNSLTNIGTSVQIVLMSSATGFTDGDEITSFMASTPSSAVTINTIDFDVSTVAELQDQPSAVEFRLYAVVAGTPGSYNRLALGHIFYDDTADDDVRVDGTVEDATSLPIVALAQWDFDGLTNEASVAADMVYAGMSSTDFAAGTPSRLNTSIGWPDSVGTLAEFWRSPSLEYAISTNNYFGFTLTPDAGKEVSYKKLFARFSANTANGSTGIVSYILLSDRTGFDVPSVLDGITVTNLPGSLEFFTHEFELSDNPEMQNITGPTDFRIYVVSPEGGNRMAFGRAWGVDGNVDIQIEGTIGDLAYVPATIVGWEFVSGGSVMKLVVDAPSDPVFYYPKGTADLTTGFSGVGHAATDAGPFGTITNLNVSGTEGDNKVIYVDASAAAKFFKIGEE